VAVRAIGILVAGTFVPLLADVACNGSLTASCTVHTSMGVTNDTVCPAGGGDLQGR
jgi:hypothetical protein